MKVQDGDALVATLKPQLERLIRSLIRVRNSDTILNHLAKGNVFEKPKSYAIALAFQENLKIINTFISSD